MKKLIMLSIALFALAGLALASSSLPAGMVEMLKSAPADVQAAYARWTTGSHSQQDKGLINAFLFPHEQGAARGRTTTDTFGGPDGYGYYWDDSVPFSWIELEGDPSATWVGAGDWSFSNTDDGYAGPYPISFNFPFYGNLYTQFWFSTNGHINFDNGDLSYWDCAPHSNGNGHEIDVRYGDLHAEYGPLADAGHVCAYRDFGSYIVIEWYRSGICCSPGADLTFEVILYPDGHIKMQYGPASGDIAYIKSIGLVQDNAGYYLEYLCETTDLGEHSSSEGLAILWGLDDILSVNLASFSATAGDNRVTLDWATASESQADRFEIMRGDEHVADVRAMNNAAGASYSWVDDQVVNGTTYRYTLVGVDISGARETLRSVDATPAANLAVVTDYVLNQNFPNPFNPSTSISFGLPEAGNVSLKVYNMMGQEVATLVNGGLSAGLHVVSFDAANLPSGLYVYKLESGSFSAQHKMLLMK